MKRHGFVILIIGLITGMLPAQSPADKRPTERAESTGAAQNPKGSWVFLQDDPENSLVRLSADERSVKLVASGVAGRGLALDKDGSYIIAARQQLLRVTPTGTVSRIAAAPPGSSWVQVVVDASGSFVVADGRKPTLWRVSADGTSVAALASLRRFDIESPEGTDRFIALTIDASGDYLLLFDGTRRQGWGPVHFLRVKPDGSLAEVQLSGLRLQCPEAIASDGRGAYVITDCGTHDAVLRVSTDGAVSKALTFREAFVGPWGIARNTAGEIIVTGIGTGQIARASGDGESLQEAAVRLKAPRAIVWDPNQ